MIYQFYSNTVYTKNDLLDKKTRIELIEEIDDHLDNVNNYNQNGFRIPLDPSATSHINNKTYAFLSNTTNNKTLVYSASFTPTSYMDVKDVEKDKDSHTPITIQNYGI